MKKKKVELTHILLVIIIILLIEIIAVLFIPPVRDAFYTGAPVLSKTRGVEPPTQELPTTQSFTITLSSDSYTISEPNAEGHQEIEMTGFGNLQIPGEPDLPNEFFRVLLPPGTEFESLEIISKNTEHIGKDYKIIFGETPQPISLDYGQVPIVPAKQKIYGSDNVYPTKIIEKGNKGQMRKYNVQEVVFNPIQYKPLSGELTLIKDISIKINYKPGELDNKILEDKVMQREAKDLFYNYNQFKIDYKDNELGGKSGVYDYVIIAPQSLATSIGMTNLINYRQDQGYLIHVETLENIQAGYSGADLPEQIRNYLGDNYLEWGIKYVLLVGTYDLIPMRSCYASYLGDDTEGDYYYQDLNGVWVSEEAECGVGVDWYPEVYISRIPLSDSAQLGTYVNKIITYESDSYSKKKDVLLATGIWHYNDPEKAARTAEYLRDNVFLPNDYTTVRMYEETGSCPCTIEHDYDVSRDNFVSHWRDDHYGIVYVASHGGPYVLSSTPCSQQQNDVFLREIDPPQLNNNYPAIIFAHACSTAYPSYDDNLAYLFAKYGGVSFTGNVHVGWTCDTMYELYFENLLNQRQVNAKALALGRLERSSHGNYGRYEALNYNLYGESLLNPFTCVDGMNETECDSEGNICLAGESYILGDVNADTKVNVGDVVYLVEYLFRDGPLSVPLEVGDVNSDSSTNVGDVVYLVQYLYYNGPAPCETPISASSPTPEYTYEEVMQFIENAQNEATK